jgi:hypothetical protein
MLRKSSAEERSIGIGVLFPPIPAWILHFIGEIPVMSDYDFLNESIDG